MQDLHQQKNKVKTTPLFLVAHRWQSTTKLFLTKAYQ